MQKLPELVEVVTSPPAIQLFKSLTKKHYYRRFENYQLFTVAFEKLFIAFFGL